MNATSSRPATTSTAGVTPRRVHSGEWLKLSGLRSTAWFVLALLLALVGLGIVPALGVAVGALDPASADGEPLAGVLAGVSTAELVAAGLGILAVTGEYASGVSRATFTAVPRRAWVVAAKAAVVAELLLLLTSVAMAAAYLTATALLGGAGVPAGPPAGAFRELAEVSLHLTLVGAFATALGWLTRSTAGGLVAFFVTFFLLPLLGAFLPDAVATTILPNLPGQATPPVLLAWTITALAAAAATARHRDV